jgi:hypothetical protein
MPDDYRFPRPGRYDLVVRVELNRATMEHEVYVRVGAISDAVMYGQPWDRFHSLVRDILVQAGALGRWAGGDR